jgi:hypothetical protein
VRVCNYITIFFHAIFPLLERKSVFGPMQTARMQKGTNKVTKLSLFLDDNLYEMLPFICNNVSSVLIQINVFVRWMKKFVIPPSIISIVLQVLLRKKKRKTNKFLVNENVSS